MTKPKFEPEQKDYFKNTHFFYEIVNQLKNVDEMKRFLKDILTSSELRMIKKRWHIAQLLTEGLDIREVAQRSRCSTGTVSKVKKKLEEGYGGLLIAIQRMQQQQHKEQRDYMKKLLPKQGSKFIKGF